MQTVFSLLLQWTIVAIKTIIIKAIEDQRLSSPSTDSKINVAMIPAITAKATLIQNSLFNLLSFSPCCAKLIGGSSFGGDSVGGDGVISLFGSLAAGASCPDSILPGSFVPCVGSDFFFLKLCQ